MARTDTPQTPQTPSPPKPPSESGSGDTAVTVERTVTITNGAQDAPQPPQPPQPPGGPPRPGDVFVREPLVMSGVSMADAIKPETRFQPQIGVSTISIDGETIIHDHLRNTNLRLNASGSFIWSSIPPESSFAELLAKIRAQHDVLPEATDRMVAEFLADLISRGALTSPP